MARIERQQTVLNILQNLRDLDGLKKLFWEELNYERENKPLSTRGWPARIATQSVAGGPDSTKQALAEDPILFASGGAESAFHIVYCRLNSSELKRGLERPIVNQLLRDHPYALFVFSNKSQSIWHFLNVKFEEKAEKRRLFRRITTGPGERLRTAAERMSLLDLQGISPDLFGLSPLLIQQHHDEAFDVEAVTQEFFHEYARIFGDVEGAIKGISDKERKRLFTQRLFNRLMFIAFIQKKGWMEFEGRTDYLDALWENYLKKRESDGNFYRERLRTLFFSGLNTPHEINLIGINRGGFLKKIIGVIPYLNGGLFEEDEDDKDSAIVVPDECCCAILENLFARFNFTVCESTPLDVDVAVDPEMLGKVFEELVTGRHESGSYYTPKPIVSFMCKEGLKGYLTGRLPNEKPEALAKFVDEHDPAGLKDPEPVLDALRRVRVCDLACGSGVYLLGMLHELAALRECLFATEQIDAVSMHARKLEIIQNNLYGVDLDPFAVNIARLRLWLSLAVEFEGAAPPPLPNLDFKIETGDSICGPSPEGKRQLSMMESVVKKINVLKDRFMMSHGEEKKTLRRQIADEKKDLAQWAHKGVRLGFDWPVEFAEVFEEGGFDILLANPPYIRQELIKDIKPVLKDTFPDVYCGTADLYCFFYCRSVEILRPGGMLVFISSNKWFRAKYGENLRKYLAENCHINSITDFGELPVFENAATFPMIFVAQKNGKAEQKQKTVFTQVKTLEPPYPDVLEIITKTGQVLPKSSIQGAAWVLTDAKSADRLRKMEKAGMPLGEYVKGHIYYGIKTGFNKAFVINGETRRELIEADPKSEEIIKPLAVGDDIRKWRIEKKDIWLILTRRGIEIEKYPAIFNHLKQFKTKLEKRAGEQKWFEIQASPADTERFEKSKIVYPVIGKELRFAFDIQGNYTNDKTFIISVNDLFLLGVLNSSITWDFLKSVCSTLGDSDKGGRLELRSIYLEKFPVPVASASDRSIIESLVKKCLKARGEGCDEWEREINERVAALYGL